jgi:hypothetical protein
MPAKKSKSRTSTTNKKATRVSPMAVAIICSLFVLVGIFLVYRSFAAAVVGN